MWILDVGYPLLRVNKTTCRLDPLDETLRRVKKGLINVVNLGSRGSHLEGPVYKVRSLGDQGSLRIQLLILFLY